MLQAEMDNHLGYEKHQKGDLITDNSRNGIYTKKVRGNMENPPSKFPVTVMASLNRL